MKMAAIVGGYLFLWVFTMAWTYDRTCLPVYDTIGARRNEGCAMLLGMTWPVYWSFTAARYFTIPEDAP